MTTKTEPRFDAIWTEAQPPESTGSRIEADTAQQPNRRQLAYAVFFSSVFWSGVLLLSHQIW